MILDIIYKGSTVDMINRYMNFWLTYNHTDQTLAHKLSN